MEFRIWVEVRLAGRALGRQLVAQVNREATGIGPEEIGLTLEEGKTVLSQVLRPARESAREFAAYGMLIRSLQSALQQLDTFLD